MNKPARLPPDAEASLALAAALSRLDAVLAAAIGELEARQRKDAASQPFRGMYVTADDAAALLAQAPGLPGWDVPPPLPGGSRFLPAGDRSRLSIVRQRFGLDATETDLLLVAASVDLDQRYERLFGLLQDDVLRRRPTVATALHLAHPQAVPQWQGLALLGPAARLLRRRLLRLESDPQQPLATLGSRHVLADPQVLHFLAGIDALEPGLRPYCRLPPPLADDEVEALWRRHPELYAAGLDTATRPLCLSGATAGERRRLAQAVAARLALPLLLADLSLLDAASDLAAALDAALLAARLRGALCLVELGGLDAATAPAALRAALRQLADEDGPCILAGRQVTLCGAAPHAAVRLPEPEERGLLWAREFAALGLHAGAADIGDAAANFELDTQQIQAAVADCVQTCAARGLNTVPRALLSAAASRQFANALPASVTLSTGTAGWSDLVLAADVAAQLREICAHARGRRQVFGDWGFAGRAAGGLNVLFSGPSGTGKSTACEILAAELGRPLLRIDLSQVLNKYIGECEKQLAQVFDHAERAGAVLLFDEADALFGKRTAVADAHDRYANTEVSYLLQRIESYRGILVLTTNLQLNIDTAFARRMHFVVEFAFPDEAQRASIWRLALPPAAPRAADLDFAGLARRYPVAGGHIRNIALGAAMLAAGAGVPIGMAQLAHAARREYQKLGKAAPDASWLGREAKP